MYDAKQGDVIMMNFTPQAGHEQGGKRPAVIVSNQAFHRYTRMAIVCPITNQIKDYPMHVKLDGRTRITGEILCEHVKSLDLAARGAVYVEKLPDDLLQEVLERVRLSVE
ncbi:MAG: type II toxin-antitoxin system PemK/MazF family toxin [Clostridia bacterium]